MPDPFSAARPRHTSQFTEDFWRQLHCRGDMRDWGNPSTYVGDEGYCLDRYSRADFPQPPATTGQKAANEEAPAPVQ